MTSIGWGVMGCGDVANKLVAPAINAAARSELIAFLSSDAARALDYAERHGAQRGYADIAEFLADPAIDAVYVSSRHDQHLPHSLAAAEAGKHVLCEKPLGLNSDECRRIIAACRSNGVNLAVAYRQRFYPKNARVKELLDDGAIGQVIFANAVHAHNYNPAPDDPKYWRTSPAASGGGPMIDGGSHLLDLLCYWLGQPAMVAGITENVLGRHANSDSEMVLLKMSSGAQVSATFHSNVGSGLNRTEIYGTRGTLTVALGNAPEIHIRTPDGEQTLELPLSGNADVPMVEDFAAAALDGRQPRFSGEDGALASYIVEGAQASWSSGRWLALEPQPASPVAA